MLLAGIDELSEVLSDTAFVLKNYSERDIYQKDIEEELNIRRASVSVLLKKLEENKMIIREGVPCDDRLKRIRPTANCMKMKGKIDQDIQLVEDRLTEGISSEQLKVFFEFHMASDREIWSLAKWQCRRHIPICRGIF